SVIARCRKGDRAAFGELVRLYQDRVFGLCLRLAGHPQDAADLAQETFVRALSSIERFDDRAAVFTWLYRIATNLAIDQRRRRRPTGVVPARHRGNGEVDDAADPMDRLPASGRRPDEHAASSEQHAAVAAAVQALDDDFRVVVVLRDVEGLDYAQIAEVLQV